METRPDASSSSAVIDRGSKDFVIATDKTFRLIALPHVSIYVCVTAISARLRRLPARATEMLQMLCEMTRRGAFGCGADWR